MKLPSARVIIVAGISIVLGLGLFPSHAAAVSGGLRPGIAGSARSVRHVSTGPGPLSKSASDSFYIYGGPGSLLGKFQALPGTYGGAPDAQGWTGKDRTERLPYWHVIALDDSGHIRDAELSGDYAVASQHEALDYTGYGNNWNDWMQMEIDLAAVGLDPSDPTSLGLEFEYSHCTEPDYDFFRVEAQRGNVYEALWAQSGSSYVDSTGIYAARFFSQQIEYAGDDYNWGGTNQVIRLLLRVTSDGAWSDEEFHGWPGPGRGAAAVDNIAITLNGAPYSFADWEDTGGGCGSSCAEGEVSGHGNGATTGTAGWLPTRNVTVGDFAKLLTRFQDIDPCRDDSSPQWSFIDDGTPPTNHPQPSLYDGFSTSPSWSYHPFVVNYTGGLNSTLDSLDNMIVSPPIEIDLPGSSDDDANGGFVLSYTVYSHLPLTNGIFHYWEASSYRSDLGWSPWDNDNHVRYSEEPRYERYDFDISDEIVGGAERLRIGLGVIDLAGLFDFPGTDATPSPLYDDVSVQKYRIGGPVLSTRTVQLMSDGFPNDQSLTGSIRWDSVIDRGSMDGPIIPGDSLTVDILPRIPGSSIVDPPGGVGGTMRAAIVCNPDFGNASTGARAAGLAAAGATLFGTVADSEDPKFGWEIYEIEVPGQQVINYGTPVDRRYFWDLPDGAPNVNASHQAGADVPGIAVLFPGDVIHYYVEASDDLGNTTRLPADSAGFLDFTASTPYSRVWTTRGLPSVVGAIQPATLWWNDAGHGAGENEWSWAWRHAGFVEGLHFDTYTTKAPTMLQSNGLGSTPHHGASPAQLGAYDCIVYTSGDLSTGLLSDGSRAAGHDKCDDLALLSSWHDQPGPRAHVYFGDDIAHWLNTSSPATQSYVQGIIGAGVGPNGGDVRARIQEQTAPVVTAVAGSGCGSFFTDYVAYGGCLDINDFDDIVPANPAVVALHEFTDPDRRPYSPRVNASLRWSRAEGGFQKKTIAFAHDLSFVQNVLNGPDEASVPRAQLLRELMSCLGHDAPGPGVVGSEEIQTKRFVVEANHPNPFNPRTTIRFDAPSPGELTLRIYNTRGQLVRESRQRAEVGPGQFEWSGRDDGGARVASGVYAYEIKGFGEVHRGRMVLLK